MLKPAGELAVDEGAVRALRAGKSLLPAGVTAVKGRFDRGDAVRGARPGRARDRARPRRLLEHRCRAHPRPAQQRARGAARLPRPRRDDPSRRPGAGVTDAGHRSVDGADRARGGRGGRRCSRSRRPTQKNAALAAAAAALRAARREILAANARDMEAARGRGPGRRDARPAGARRDARRGHGAGRRGDRGAARSGRHRDRRVDAAERPAHPARARAARRDRHHLREPAQRDRRRRRAVPQVGQRGDPARRLREPPLERARSTPAWWTACARPACPRPASSWCRPPTAPPSATCSPA